MSDDLNKRNNPDSKLISLEEEHEVKYWTKALGVSEEELRKAVEKVGHSAEAVREQLR